MNPIVAMDVSKGKSVAAIFSDHHHVIKDPFEFSHEFDDLLSLTETINFLCMPFSCRPKIVMEATGVYSKSLAEFFFERGYEVYVLNPLTTSHIKSKSLRKVKTDPIDTMRIAHAFYTLNLSPFKPQSAIYQELRMLSRQYDGINKTYQELVVRLHTIVDLVFPNFNRVFYSVRSKSALRLFLVFPTPQSILKATPQEIAQSFHSDKRNDAWHLDKAHKLIEAVKDSAVPHSAQVPVLSYYAQILLGMQNTLNDIRTQMNKLARQSPHYELLTSIPGVGEVTASVILSEIGDISRFHSKKQLVAFAGLDPTVYQSGKYQARSGKISKRGTPYLRKALYMAASIGISKRSSGYINSVLRAHYDHLIDKGKPKRLALTATSCKLLRIIFGMIKNNTTFINQ